jgi:hypothetical protein
VLLRLVNCLMQLPKGEIETSMQRNEIRQTVIWKWGEMLTTFSEPQYLCRPDQVPESRLDNERGLLAAISMSNPELNNE